MRLREGDTVQVMSGADRGKQGKILRVLDGGDAKVLGNDTCTDARWARPTQTSPTTLATADGRPITLAPGQTWVFTVGLGPTMAPDGTERTATTS